MRKSLLLAICFALSSGVAGGQVPVTDAGSLLMQAKQLAQEAKAYLIQAQQYATQVQQYATEVQQLEAFVHDPSLGAAMGLMNQAGLSNSLPVNPYAVASLTNGYGSLTSLAGVLGKLGQLNGLVNTNFAANHVYSCTDASASCAALNANANAIAGMQGAAQSADQDLRTHLTIIQALRDRLLTATNPKDVADVSAQLQAETVWTQNLMGEVAAIDANYRAQRDSVVQRDNEGLDKGLDDFLADRSAAGRGL